MQRKDDDDDLEPSTSEQEAFTSADPRKEKLRRQMERKKGKTLESGKVELKSQVELDKLRDDLLDGKKDDETKRQEENQKDDEDKVKSRIPHTESVKEREKNAIATAKDKPGPDILIKREEQQEDISPEEQIKQPG